MPFQSNRCPSFNFTVVVFFVCLFFSIFPCRTVEILSSRLNAFKFLWQANSAYTHNLPAWARTDLLHTNGKVLSKRAPVPLCSPSLQSIAVIALIFHPPLLMMQPFTQKRILSNLKCKK